MIQKSGNPKTVEEAIFSHADSFKNGTSSKLRINR